MSDPHSKQTQHTGNPLPLCVLIGTGGTIASRIDPATGLAVPLRSAADLLEATPRLASLSRLEVEEVCQIPSPHIGPAQWIALHQKVTQALARPEVSGVIIAHGTALLEETAWFLDLTLTSPKPVILIGAQRNASDPDFDGAFNLFHAVRVCLSPDARDKGVMVVLNQHINAAREVTKTHTFDVETFNSGEWGYLGNAASDRVTFHRSPLRRLHLPLKNTPLPEVEIISMYGGANGRLIEACIGHVPGIVIQAVGAGHVTPGMAAAIHKAIDHGMRVVVSTRIPRGAVRPCYGFPGASQLLQNAGAILASDLSPWKARILLMLAMQSNLTDTEIKRLFEQ